MNSFYFGLALFAVVLIIHWYIINDGKGQDDGSIGFLAMKSLKPLPPPEPKPTTKRSFRRNA